MAIGFDEAQALTAILYSGEAFDSRIGLQYLRARWYDPNTGRFNRLDPFSGNLSDPQSLHKYLYTHGDPVNGWDPTGWEFTTTGTLAVVGGAVALQISALPRAAHLFQAGKELQWQLLANGYVTEDLETKNTIDFVTRDLARALNAVDEFLNPEGGPGFVEGMIPVWGDAKTAYAHAKLHNYGYAAVYATMAALDAISIGTTLAIEASGKGFLKGGIKGLLKQSPEALDVGSITKSFDEFAQLTNTSGRVGEVLDTQKVSRIVANLEKRGVTVHRGPEWDALLDLEKAGAIYQPRSAHAFPVLSFFAATMLLD